jgi:hypothetical protein
VPPTTPKPLRQLITDTLTNKPDRRPLPETWTYLLGHVIEETQDRAPTPPTSTQPEPAHTHKPEPQPVVQRRPTTTPAKQPLAARVTTSATTASAPSATSLFPKRTWTTIGVVAAGLLVAGALIALAHSSSNGSSQSTPRTKSAPISGTQTTESASTTTPTASMSPVERSIRNAQAGECFRRTTGGEKSDGSLEVLGLNEYGCGNSGSEVQVMSVHPYRAGDPMPCESSSTATWLRSGGQDPQVVLCLIYDPAH